VARKIAIAPYANLIGSFSKSLDHAFSVNTDGRHNSVKKSVNLSFAIEQIIFYAQAERFRGSVAKNI